MLLSLTCVATLRVYLIWSHFHFTCHIWLDSRFWYFLASCHWICVQYLFFWKFSCNLIHLDLLGNLFQILMHVHILDFKKLNAMSEAFRAHKWRLFSLSLPTSTCRWHLGSLLLSNPTCSTSAINTISTVIYSSHPFLTHWRLLVTMTLEVLLVEGGVFVANFPLFTSIFQLA